MKAPSYSFCESSAAGPLAPWHIRPLTDAGKKLSGGVDTESLCGHVTRKFGGWDLEVPLEGYPLDKVTDGRRHVCKRCAERYRVREPQKPVVTFKDATDRCCEILNGGLGTNPAWASTRWPAVYKGGGMSIKHERVRYSVTVDVDPMFDGGKLGWKVRVSCNATQLPHEKAAEFAKLYAEAVEVARITQTYMDSIEIDLKTILT